MLCTLVARYTVVCHSETEVEAGWVGSHAGKRRTVCTMTKPTIRGVVFDMDGTLTVPAIAFSEMRLVGV